MIKHQEAISLKKVAIGAGIAIFLKKAKDIVSGLITRVSNAVSDVLGRGGNASDAQDTIDGMFDYVPDQTAVTIIHDEVESGVNQVFDGENVEYVECVCSPGACQVCLDNQSAGPIKRGEEFPSGHERAPFHFCCRCVMVPSEGDV